MDYSKERKTIVRRVEYNFGKKAVTKQIVTKNFQNKHLSKLCDNLEDEPLLKSRKVENENLFEGYYLIEGNDLEHSPEISYSSINSGYETKYLTYSAASDEYITSLETELFRGNSIVLSKRRLGDAGAPKDTFFLAHTTSFFFGISGMLPLTFFLVANDYWMYKFRDVSQGHYNLNNKTYFQTMFVSMNSACSSVPCLVSVLLTTMLGHNINSRKRIITSLGISSFLFAVSTALIKINTDTWQCIFFIFTITILSVIAFIQPLLNITIMAYLSKLPKSYVQSNMYGSAAGGLFGSTLQIISLSIGKNSTQIALIYFSIGTILMSFTCFLAYLMKYSPVIQHYVYINEDSRKSKYTFKEYLLTANKVWFIILIVNLLALGAGLGHPNITNLIVSEGYTGTGNNLWYDKYFAVTAIYFLFDVFQLLGRFVGRPLMKKSNYPWFLLLSILRTYGNGILFWFCNAQPRNNLPVWFPRDYQYMTIMIVYSFFGSALATLSVLSIAPIAKEKTELAYILTASSMTLTSTFASIFNPMFITML